MKSRVLPRKIKGIIWNLAYASGLLAILEKARVGPNHKGMIFYYHRVHPEPGWDPVGLTLLPPIFRRQMMIIKKKFHPLSLTEFYAYLKGPISSYRAPPIVITFDDGYRDVLFYAWPIMKDLGIPSAFFICTDPVMQGLPLVWDLLTISIQGDYRKEIRVKKFFTADRIYSLRTLQEKAHFVLEMNQNLLGRGEGNRRNTLHELFGPILTERAAESRGLYLKPEQIRECLNNKMEIGSHTASHPYLPDIPYEELDREIKGSKEVLESFLGREVAFFSYPAGKFNEKIRETVRQAGYQGALATGGRAVFPLDQDPFSLPRISPEGIAAEGKFYALVSGIRPDWFKP